MRGAERPGAWLGAEGPTFCTPWFLDLPDEPEHPERASVDGADRSTPKRRELPDPDERGRIYEAMRAHASAETAGEPSDATGESQHDRRADGAG
jgi:hypothetical protein